MPSGVRRKHIELARERAARPLQRLGVALCVGLGYATSALAALYPGCSRPFAHRSVTDSQRPLDFVVRDAMTRHI